MSSPAQTWRPPMADLWRRFCPGPQTRWRIRGQLPLNLFCAPQILLCSETFIAPKNAFCSAQTLKPGYGPGFAKIVSEMRIFCFEGHSASRFFYKSRLGGPL